MKLTKVLFGYRHPRMYFFDKKWDRLHGRRHVNPGWFKVWRRKWYVERKREVTQLPVELPSEDTKVLNAHEWLNDEKLMKYEAELVWPYEKKFVRGEPDDPYYKKEIAYVFNRSTKQWEGFKGALNFTNTILEGEELPQDIAAIEETVNLDQDILDYLDRKLRFALHTDGMMNKLPPLKEFPFISKTPPKIAGVPISRKESNILNAFYEAANLHICKKYGLMDRRRLNNPECIYPFERESRRCILDLWCDFLTLSRREKNSFCLPSDNSVKIFKDPSSTEDENLVDIHPINWEICFDPTHLWPEKYVMSTPIDDQIHTIYLTDCAIRFKPLPDRMAKGRNVMFCYGYSVAQFRRWYGNWEDWKDPLNYVDLTNPILINCVDVNSSKMKMSFASFQLNTTSFDSSVKNQVWLDGAFSIKDDKELILKKVIAINLFGAHNKSNPELYKKIEEQPKEASINVH